MTNKEYIKILETKARLNDTIYFLESYTLKECTLREKFEIMETIHYLKDFKKFLNTLPIIQREPRSIATMDLENFSRTWIPRN